MLITDLPVETLDRIAGELESPTDVQNLAGSNRLLRSIVFPRHTQLRVIRSPLRSSIWEKFINDRSLAQNVRTLEIQDAEIRWNRESVDPPVTPAIFGELSPHVSDDGGEDKDKASVLPEGVAKNAADLRAERRFVLALRNMTGLMRFKWSRTPPLINPKDEVDVWTVLVEYCPDLRHVNVVDLEKPHDPSVDDNGDDDAYQRPTHNPTFFTLKNLKSFVMATDAYNVGSYGMPDTNRFAEMLVQHNPDLEVLKLDVPLYQNPIYKAADASPLLSHVNWNSLRELRLFYFSAPSHLWSSFFVSHPTIESLSLWNIKGIQRVSVSTSDHLILPPDLLPSLKYLDAMHEDFYAVFIPDLSRNPRSSPRPLERIRGPILDDYFLKLLELSGSGATLKRLDMRYCFSPDLVVKLARLAPGVEWLNLCYSSGSVKRGSSDDWCSALAHFPSLITFEGFQFLSSRKSSADNSETIRTLLTACPKLRRVPWYMGTSMSRSVVIITREGNTVRWELRARLGDAEGDIDEDWGEHGRGCFEL